MTDDETQKSTDTNTGEELTEFVAEEEAENPTAALKKLREKLKICRAERQEYLDISQRLRADYLNFKKETEAAKGEVAKWATADLLLEFLTVADTFDLAFANRAAWEAVAPGWRQGVEHIYAQLQEILQRHGVQIIETVGGSFNPEEHHSVGSLETGRPEEDNVVLELVQRGYRLNGKVLRPAKVRVGQFKKQLPDIN